MKKTNLLLMALLGIFITMTMCSKDDDDDGASAYIGNWETEEFNMEGQNVKMEFDFAAANFTGEIKVIAGAVSVGILGIKGDISEKPDQLLDISLTDLGRPNTSGGYDYKNRTDDAAEFNALYQGFLANSMPLDFEAEYIVVGNQMDLIIDDVDVTLVMFRK